MRRRAFIALLAATAGADALAQARTVRRVGFLYPGRYEVISNRLAAFHRGLANPSDGMSFDVIARFGEGDPDQLRAMATELVNLGVDVLHAASPAAVRAARQATNTVPIVAMDLETDPIASGWIASLARPGGNMTGIFLDGPEFSAKLLQLLREAVPNLTKLAVLWDPATGSFTLDAVRNAAAGLDIGVNLFEVRSLPDLDTAFEKAGSAKVHGVLMLSSPIFGGNPQRAADLTMRYRLPAITLFPEFARRGGLIAYGPDIEALYTQAGAFCRKVLLGAKPAETPVERPITFILVANSRSAKTLGIDLSTSVLLRANEVIE